MKKFDKDKYLRKKYVYFSIITFMILGISLIVVDKNGVKQKFDNSISNESLIGTYIDGEYSENIPGKNDGYVVEKIVCDNDAVAEWDSETWGILVKNMTKKSKCNIYFKKYSNADILANLAKIDTVNFATDDPDNNIRYIGKNPDNYVYFNCSDYNNQSDNTCEKWRIIGVFNNVTKSDGTKEDLVKIIRDESIGNYSWDNKDTTTGAEEDDGQNDWSTARLNYLLNSGHESDNVGGSLYWNAKSGTCYAGKNNATTSCDFTSTGLKNATTRNAIESVVWNIGGRAGYTEVTNGLTKHFYNYERGKLVYDGHATIWIGKIGLMYPSDYGFSTDGNDTTSRSNCLAKELYNWDTFSDCYTNSYLYKSDYNQWTLMINHSKASLAMRIYSDGRVRAKTTFSTFGVRPTLYLKSNIKIKTGTGSSDNPYQFSL